MSDPADHVVTNRSYWDGMADDWIGAGERAWASELPYWGQWEIPEVEVGMIPADMTGLRAIDLGCGTGYVSAWMARRGATVVAIDNSCRQLDTARRLAAEHGLEIEWFHGNAEQVDQPDASFDFAISEYGAATWADPYLWIPEAHRLLRAEGRLVFLGNTPLTMICSPLDGSSVDERLHRPYFGMHRADWTEVESDPGGVEFNLTISDWMRLFRSTGFEVEDYIELQAPSGRDDSPFAVSAAWSRRFPSEHVWKLVKS